MGILLLRATGAKCSFYLYSFVCTYLHVWECIRICVLCVNTSSSLLHWSFCTGSNTALSFNFTKLIPDGNIANYYTYSGSLTTPGCNEAVTWLMMSDIVYITNAQVRRRAVK